MSELIALLRYFGVVFSEGDWANDWLTHLPADVAQAAEVLGKWIAPWFMLMLMLPFLAGCAAPSSVHAQCDHPTYNQSGYKTWGW